MKSWPFTDLKMRCHCDLNDNVHN